MAFPAELLNSEKHFMELSEKVIIDIQRLLYEKPGLQDQKVVAVAVDLEGRIYKRALYDTGGKEDEHAWRKREAIQAYIQLSERIKRNLAERDMSKQEWLKELRDKKSLFLSLAAEGRIPVKRKAISSAPVSKAKVPKRTSTGGAKAAKTAKPEPQIPKKPAGAPVLPLGTAPPTTQPAAAVAAPAVPAVAAPKPTAPPVAPLAAAAAPLSAPGLAAAESTDMGLADVFLDEQEFAMDDALLGEINWTLTDHLEEIAQERNVVEASSWSQSRAQREEDQQREGLLQRSKELQREELEKQREERLSEVQKQHETIKEMESAVQREEEERQAKLEAERRAAMEQIRQMSGATLFDANLAAKGIEDLFG